MSGAPRGKTIALAGLLAGLAIGLLDGAQSALRSGLGGAGLLATAALTGGLGLLLGVLLGGLVGGLSVLTRWGRARSLSRGAAAAAWALVGLAAAGAAAGAIVGTGGRNNRFLAAGVVVLDVALVAIAGALIAPALGRLFSRQRRAAGNAGGRSEAVEPRATAAGLLLLAPLLGLALLAVIFVAVWRTRAPLSAAERSSLVAACGAVAVLVPFTLAWAAGRLARITRAWAAGAAVLLFGAPGAAFVWLNWTKHLQFLPWRDVRVMALIVAAGAGLAFALRGRTPGPVRLWALLLGAPVVAGAAFLVAGGSEIARKAASTHGGLVSPVLMLVRPALDFDGDGYPGLLGGGDCDDRDPTVHPGAQDWPDDGVDQDCDGMDLSLQALRSPPLHPVPDSIPRDLNVLFIVIDTLRADRLGSYGYPRPTTPVLDRLAAEGTLFENGWAHAPSTRYSLPAIVTGRWPSAIKWDHSIFWPRIDPGQRTIAEAMRDLGYFTGAFYAYYDYFRRSDARGFERGVDLYKDERGLLHQNVGGPAESVGTSSREMADDAIAFLEQHGSKKFFLSLHFYDPHLNFHRHPQAPDFGASQSDLYDGEVWYTDHHIGRVLDRLSALGLADKTAIFVTGDHGEGFGEHGIVAHGYHLYAAQTKVPFVARVPGVAPRRVKAPVGHVDIAPTLVNLARGPHEPSFLGRSMLDLMLDVPGASPPPQYLFQEVLFEGPTDRRGIVSATHHLLWNRIPDNTTYCFDLVADPAESRDLWGTPRGEPACPALKTELQRHVALMRLAELPADFAQKIAAGVVAPGAPAPVPQHRLAARFGDVVGFLGYDLSSPRVARGGQIEVTVYFEVLKPVTGWRTFFHVNGPPGGWMLLDHTPVEGAYPVDRWRPGQRIADRFVIPVPPSAPPGPYTLHVGFWRPPAASNQRLEVSPAQAQDGDNRLRVLTFTVE